MNWKRLSIIGPLLMGGCAVTPVGPSSSAGQAPGIRVPAASIQARDIVGRWELIGIDGIPITSGKVILAFEADGSYRRQVSCNQGTGRYRIADGVLSLSGVRETERGCDPYENEALIDQAVSVGPWILRSDGRDALILEGRHKLSLIRYTGSPGRFW